MTRATIAKILAYGGGALGTLAAAGTFGPKWGSVITAVSGALVAISAALASDTSAGHPNGAATTVAESTPLKTN